MKFLAALLASLILAAPCSAQTQAPSAGAAAPLPPERPSSGPSNLNLKLDESALRRLGPPASEPVRDQPGTSSGGNLPALGSGARSFDPPGGFGRPKSDSRAFPKSAE